MTQSTATECGRCGAVLPHGAGASASDRCPQCGHPADPDATLHPGPPPTPWPAPDSPDMPARLPLAPLVTLAVSCALMGVMLGVWIGWQRVTPAQRMEVRLPPLLPPGPALSQPAAPRQYYPVPRPTGLPPLPPARVVPSEGRQATGDRRPFGMGWGAPPGARLPSAPIRRAAAPAAPRAPLRAKGMATVHISNPSDRAIDVTLSGAGEQSGVVGPRSAVDFLIPPGHYDVALRGAARTQRFYDAPLTEGDVLELVYSEKP